MFCENVRCLWLLFNELKLETKKKKKPESMKSFPPPTYCGNYNKNEKITVTTHETLSEIFPGKLRHTGKSEHDDNW